MAGFPLRQQETYCRLLESATTSSRPLHICLISPLGYGLYNPESGYPFGGAEVQLFLLANMLASDPEYRVTVLTTVHDSSGDEQCGALTVVKRQGKGRLSRHQTTRSMIGAVRDYGEAFGEMRDVLRRIDADIYVHAGAGVEVGAYALICCFLRRRFIYVVASSADLDTTNRYVRGPLRWLFPVGCRLAHAIVCRTVEQQKRLHDCYGREGVLIRTGHVTVDGIETERSTILWVGRIHPLKQPQMFLDLAGQFPHEYCVMVGMYDPVHENLWREVRQRASCMANVAWHENVAFGDVNRYFSPAKVLVNTSLYEGFPNTFVQAALHGVPIVSWAVNPDEVLTKHRIGSCAGGAYLQLTASVRMLCENEGSRVEYGRRALAYGLESHDLNRSAAGFKKLFRSLVA